MQTVISANKEAVCSERQTVARFGQTVVTGFSETVDPSKYPSFEGEGERGKGCLEEVKGRLLAGLLTLLLGLWSAVGGPQAQRSLTRLECNIPGPALSALLSCCTGLPAPPHSADFMAEVQRVWDAEWVRVLAASPAGEQRLAPRQPSLLKCWCLCRAWIDWLTEAMASCNSLLSAALLPF